MLTFTEYFVGASSFPPLFPFLTYIGLLVKVNFWMQVYGGFYWFFALTIPDGGSTGKWLLIAEVHAESHLGL
jgi:hypothetical protein